VRHLAVGLQLGKEELAEFLRRAGRPLDTELRESPSVYVNAFAGRTLVQIGA
jgi:hypothetical protein